MNFKNKNKFIQYQLWLDCSIGCNFCMNLGQKDINKLQSLKYIKNKLLDTQIFDYNEVGFSGGEFFNSQIKEQSIKLKFYQLFQIISNYNHVQKIYITAALIYDINTYLIPFLQYLRSLNVLHKCLLCTSYDLKYRFKTAEKQMLWKNNILRLHQQFPQLNIHVQTIVTQFFIDAVLNKEFNIHDFKSTLTVSLDFIQPQSGLFFNDKKHLQWYLNDFFPTKTSVIKFLIQEGVKNKNIDLYTFCSKELSSNKLYYINDGKRCCIDNRRSINYIIKPIDNTKKFQTGMIDSDLSINELAIQLCNMYGGTDE